MWLQMWNVDLDRNECRNWNVSESNEGSLNENENVLKWDCNVNVMNFQEGGTNQQWTWSDRMYLPFLHRNEISWISMNIIGMGIECNANVSIDECRINVMYRMDKSIEWTNTNTWMNFCQVNNGMKMKWDTDKCECIEYKYVEMHKWMKL